MMKAQTGSGRVAYQGAPGAFSHEACAALRPWDEAIGYASFKEAIDAVRNRLCHSALIPIENSTIGVVEPAATLVRGSGLTILSEAWRPIRLALMAPPGTRLSDVRTVESHAAALGQCFDTLWSMKLESREVFDTAGAARDVAAAGDRTRAAIAPAAAATIYGLTILRHDLQDSSDNRTRFVLLGLSEA
jgi:prephenate dehydratase